MFPDAFTHTHRPKKGNKKTKLEMLHNYTMSAKNHSYVHLYCHLSPPSEWESQRTRNQTVAAFTQSAALTCQSH